MNRSGFGVLRLPTVVALISLSACGGGGGGGAAVDVTPPTIIATDPPVGAVGVEVNQPIVATFNEAILPASVTSTSFRVTDDMSNPVSGAVSTSGRTTRFTPAQNALVKSTTYQATLTTAVTDLAGNPLAADFNWHFRTMTDAWTATAVNLTTPTARLNHTAVWTGGEMIIWGGTGGVGVLNSGGRYDPSKPDASAWTQTTMANVPSARTGHTAIWDRVDNEMIVWGGESSVGLTNTGSQYDPTADTWTPTSTPPAVLNFLPRSLHSAVWTGDEMIVWGGLTNIGPIRDGAEYQPATDSWNAIALSGAPSARFSHTAIWTGTEMIVWGGDPGGGLGFTNTGGRFRPSTGDWRPVSTVNAPLARIGHTAVWTGKEMIVWGGTADGVTALNDGALYDPATDTWHPMQNAPIARTGHDAIWTGTEMIIWGGDNTAISGAAYNPAHNTWRMISSVGAPTARVGQTAIWTGNEMIVWGGNDGTLTNTGRRYTP